MKIHVHNKKPFRGSILYALRRNSKGDASQAQDGAVRREAAVIEQRNIGEALSAVGAESVSIGKHAVNDGWRGAYRMSVAHMCPPDDAKKCNNNNNNNNDGNYILTVFFKRIQWWRAIVNVRQTNQNIEKIFETSTQTGCLKYVDR